MTQDQAKAQWRKAKTFAELCDLTARFIEGELPYFPGYGAPEVDEETDPLVPYLACFNRAGFLTTMSQPGEDDPDWKQRAFVDGYALELVARRIIRLGLCSDLHIVAAPNGGEQGFHTPVILRDFLPHGWAGFTSFDELSFFAEVCSPAAMSEIKKAWSISIIDLQWGRTEHLWRELSRELCIDERTHPDLL